MQKDVNKQEKANIDVIAYAGEINVRGYHAICNILKKRVGKKVLLVLATPGGDPHAGFRIARALQHEYEEFSLLVPRYCKSAGTLIAIGASKLFLDDMSELGPLDVQVKKNDELMGLNSGLDIIAAVDYLRDQSMEAFNKHCVELVAEAGLSTKAASDIAVKLSIGMLEPIAAQVDPMKLAEMQRAMGIAYQYGGRLNEKSKNLRAEGLDMLVTGYPSHSFVIDRKEAKSIFIEVARPSAFMKILSEGLQSAMEKDTNNSVPSVSFGSYDIDFFGDDDENTVSTTEQPQENFQSDDHLQTELCSDEESSQVVGAGASDESANDSTRGEETSDENTATGT